MLRTEKRILQMVPRVNFHLLWKKKRKEKVKLHSPISAWGLFDAKGSAPHGRNTLCSWGLELREVGMLGHQIFCRGFSLTLEKHKSRMPVVPGVDLWKYKGVVLLTNGRETRARWSSSLWSPVGLGPYTDSLTVLPWACYLHRPVSRL